MNTENYTHLAVNKFTNLIVNGWDYADVEPSELKEFKNDYFIVDLKDYGFNPKVYKIVTSKFAEKNGINQWSNTGVYPLEEEYKMKDEGINFSEKAYEEHPDWFYEDVSESIKRNNRNKDMKQTIKLSESELKKIVAESVKGAINELDWRTYANAAKKAREQGRDSRWDFDRATERALDKQYGGHHLVGTDNETYQDFHTYNNDPFSTNYDRAWRPLEGHEDFGSYADVHDSKKPYGNEDISDFVHGKSKYEKGKGWSNESMKRRIDRIVSETLKRTLN